MDIQKEREAFEAYIKSIYPMGEQLAKDCGKTLCELYSSEWQSWQAAKAQAVPEGFVLVPKEPDADLVNHGHQVFLGHFNEGGQTGGRSLYFAYKAMIEAQEPAND